MWEDLPGGDVERERGCWFIRGGGCGGKRVTQAAAPVVACKQGRGVGPAARGRHHMPKTDRATPWGLRAVASALALACFMLAPVAVRAQDADVDPACVEAGIVDASACADFLAANAPPADEPVVEEPVPDEPVVEEPVVEEPVVEGPVVDEPVVDEPVPDEPVVEQPAVEEPVVPDQPAVEDPAPVDTTSDLDPACAAAGITDADGCASFLTGGDQPVPEEPSVDAPADEPVVTDTMSEAPVVNAVPADESAVDGAPSDEPVVEDSSSTEPAVDTPADVVTDETSSDQPAVSDEPSAEPVVDPAVEDDTAFTGDDAPTDAAFTDETPITTDDQGQQVEPIADLPPDTDPTGRAAAFHAANGVTGPRFILEGQQGIYAATCHAPKPMIAGEGWRIAEVSFKPWGACRHAHPAISSVIVVGAMLATGLAESGWAMAFGFIAVTLASVNIFGGFVVTQRMLSMFKKK
eukprot:gene34973-46989_t